MDKALYTSLSGAIRVMDSQRMHANNLANLSTSGFRADYLNAVAQTGKRSDDDLMDTRIQVTGDSQWTDLSQGQLSHTGRDLDLAVEGDGWFTLVNEQGDEAYTRDGSFYADAQGVLRNPQGWQVMGEGGPIQLPDYEKLDVGSDGRISVIMNGSKDSQIAMVGQLKLVNPNSADLSKGNDGLFRLPPDQVSINDPTITVVSGYLEGSNSNAVAEMVSFVNLTRNFEMQLKMMKSVEQMSQAGDELLRK